ncbi:hypothetical protein D3C80_1316490 [compost metagenome]
MYFPASPIGNEYGLLCQEREHPAHIMCGEGGGEPLQHFRTDLVRYRRHRFSSRSCLERPLHPAENLPAVAFCFADHPGNRFIFVLVSFPEHKHRSFDR